MNYYFLQLIARHIDPYRFRLVLCAPCPPLCCVTLPSVIRRADIFAVQDQDQDNDEEKKGKSRTSSQGEKPKIMVERSVFGNHRYVPIAWIQWWIHNGSIHGPQEASAGENNRFLIRECDAGERSILRRGEREAFVYSVQHQLYVLIVCKLGARTE